MDKDSLRNNNKFAGENRTTFRLFSSSLKAMLACEHSELPRASSNIMAILLKEVNSTASRLFSVINGLVPLILVQQVTNQVNKLALLLHKEYVYTRLSGQAR